MGEDRLTSLELKQKQLIERLDNIEKKPKKDIWDIMNASTPLISGILISGIGLYFAYSNNQAQLKLQETQTIERFFPHLNGTEQEKKAAILAISSLTNTETAAKYAELFPSEGTASALKTIAASSTVQAHDKDVANKALMSTFHKMADNYQAIQNTSQAAQAYQQSVDIQSQLEGSDSPELVESLSQLAEAYKSDQKYTLAETTLKRILKIQKTSFGTRDPKFINTLNKLASVFKLEGNSDAAERTSEYATLLAQQKTQDTSSSATGSASAISEVITTTADTSLNGTDSVINTAKENAPVASNQILDTTTEPAEVQQKKTNNKVDLKSDLKTENKTEQQAQKSAASAPYNTNM